MQEKEWAAGTKVRIARGNEASDKVYITRCKPWKIGGVEVVQLDGLGVRATKFLEVVDDARPCKP